MAIIHYPFRRIRDKFQPEPLPHIGSFDGQNVLITGGTTGLGLAAAIHFARLGAKVIITSRDRAKGEAAQRKIEIGAEKTHDRDVTVLELDMTRYESCMAFVKELKEHCTEHGRLTCAVLNAGVIKGDEYEESPEGWEETMQINVLSTVLLALLLLLWLQSEHEGQTDRPHLVFVASRAHLDPDITDWPKYATEEGILRHFSDRAQFPAAELMPNYGVCKLLLMYAIGEMSRQVTHADGRPRVIINSVCPGLVHTDIGRSIVQRSLFWKMFLPTWLSILGKSPENGARIYVRGCCTQEADHGKFLQTLYSEEEYESFAEPNLKSTTGINVQRAVWHELMTELLPHLHSAGVVAWDPDAT